MISKKLSIVHCQLSIILAFLPLSVAYAQQDSTLNRTVVVENEYNPNIMDASKINVLPKVEEPAVMKKGIEYATALRPVSVWTYESMSPITREWAMNARNVDMSVPDMEIMGMWILRLGICGISPERTV